MEEAKDGFRDVNTALSFSRFPTQSYTDSRSSQQGTLNPFASLIDNDDRKLHMGFLGRVLGLSQAGRLSQDESPDFQVKIEESQLLCFLTLFTDLLGPVSFHLGTA